VSVREGRFSALGSWIAMLEEQLYVTICQRGGAAAAARDGFIIAAERTT
jgi:hypothetical protein